MSAERQAERALMLDPGDGTTHGAVGVVDALRGNWLGSAMHFRTSRALGSDAFTSGVECGYLTQSVGHIRRAVHDAEQIFNAAPTQPIGAQMLALTYLCQGRNAEARHYADLSVQLGQSPTVAPLPEIYGLLALRAGRYADATEQLSSAQSPRARAAGGSQAVEGLCAALQDPAYRNEANAAIDDLEARLQPEDLDQPMRKRPLLWRTMLGNLDAAYAFLTRCLDHYARGGTVGSAWGSCGCLKCRRSDAIRDSSRSSRDCVCSTIGGNTARRMIASCATERFSAADPAETATSPFGRRTAGRSNSPSPRAESITLRSIPPSAASRGTSTGVTSGR